jgi:hypothetical protein
MTEVEQIVTRARRARILFVLAIAGICLTAIAALAGAIVANVVNAQQDSKITRVERNSACEVDANSHACQQIKRESAKAASLYTTCIPFFKAGYPCPKPGSKAAERETRSSNPAPATSGSPVAAATLPTGAGHPVTHPQESSPAGGAPAQPHPTNPPSHAPIPTGSTSPAGPAESPSAASAPRTEAEQASGSEAPMTAPAEQRLLPSTLEAVGTTVTGAGEVVGHALCTVTGLLNHTCSE